MTDGDVRRSELLVSTVCVEPLASMAREAKAPVELWPSCEPDLPEVLAGPEEDRSWEVAIPVQ